LIPAWICSMAIIAEFGDPNRFQARLQVSVRPFLSIRLFVSSLQFSWRTTIEHQWSSFHRKVSTRLHPTISHF
jgi:hypothetical protein